MTLSPKTLAVLRGCNAVRQLEREKLVNALAECRATGNLLYDALVNTDEEGLVEAAEPMRAWRRIRALATKEAKTDG